MFASRTKKTISLQEGDEVITVVIRKLSGRSLEKAQEVRQGVAAKTARDMGPEMMRIIREEANALPKEDQPKPAPTEAEERAAVYASYDRYTVLCSGIESWSAKQSVSSGVDDLDEDSCELLFHEIIDLSRPSVKKAEEQLGKD